MPARKPKSRLRRAVLASLASLALAAFVGPQAASGCSAGFEPISQVDALRVLAVVADEPYAQPGDQVTFTMTYVDGVPPVGDAGPRPLNVLWLAGCTNPAGDEYYGCYSLFDGGTPSVDITPLTPTMGDTFTMTVPPDILQGRTYGLAIVFFAVCAGQIKVVPPDGTGAAGSFPLGCFDADGKALGADSFVPGYTQVYVFADGRQNANPPVDGLSLNGAILDDRAGAASPGSDLTEVPAGHVLRCPVSEDDRGSAGCGKTDPSKACTDYELSVFFNDPTTVAEPEPKAEGTAPDGGVLMEEVWVDYFADQGDIDTPVLLVNDATTGLQSSYSTRWFAPPTAGTAHIWAVVHDSRGGESVIERQLTVQ